MISYDVSLPSMIHHASFQLGTSGRKYLNWCTPISDVSQWIWAVQCWCFYLNGWQCLLTLWGGFATFSNKGHQMSDLYINTLIHIQAWIGCFDQNCLLEFPRKTCFPLKWHLHCSNLHCDLYYTHGTIQLVKWRRGLRASLMAHIWYPQFFRALQTSAYLYVGSKWEQCCTPTLFWTQFDQYY